MDRDALARRIQEPLGSKEEVMLVRIFGLFVVGALLTAAQLTFVHMMSSRPMPAVTRHVLPPPPSSHRCMADGRCLQVPADVEEIVFAEDDGLAINVTLSSALAQR